MPPQRAVVERGHLCCGERLRQAGVGSCLVSGAELHEPSKRHWNYREGLSIFVMLEGVGDIICGAYGYKSRQDVKLVTRTPSLGQRSRLVVESHLLADSSST